MLRGVKKEPIEDGSGDANLDAEIEDCVSIGLGYCSDKARSRTTFQFIGLYISQDVKRQLAMLERKRSGSFSKQDHVVSSFIACAPIVSI